MRYIDSRFISFIALNNGKVSSIRIAMGRGRAQSTWPPQTKSHLLLTNIRDEARSGPRTVQR